MASLDQLKTALRNAEAKGATQDAALLANAIKERTPAPPRDRAAEEAAINLRLAQLQPGSVGQGIAEFGKGILGGAAGILETGAIGAADFFVPDSFDDPVREGIQGAFDVIQKPLAPACKCRRRCNCYTTKIWRSTWFFWRYTWRISC